jgi:hypothetical protein
MLDPVPGFRGGGGWRIERRCKPEAGFVDGLPEMLGRRGVLFMIRSSCMLAM